MSTVVLPRPIRDAALDIFAERLGYRPSLETQLADLGDPVTVELMLAVEQRFGILIDPDEILPHGTIDTLLRLTVTRSCSRPVPTETFTLIDLAAARAERARRARARAAMLPSITDAEAALLAAAGPQPVEAPPPTPATAPAEPAPTVGLVDLMVGLYRHDPYAQLLMNLGGVCCATGLAIGLVFWIDFFSPGR